MKPIPLAANRFPRFYRGGSAIDELRGGAPGAEGAFFPEDWVGSTTAAFGSGGEGLTRLEAGRTLREAIHSDPEGFLGRRHAEAYGDDPALLVKLLHAGERLPVHCHPDRDFARHHLGCPWGKTEAWVILGSDAPDPVVHLGFREDMGSGRLAELVEAQRVETLLTALNTIPVAAGDTVLVPAGMPHAIGRGVLLVELQEPTDFSVLLEWEGFAIDGRAEGHLGLGFDLALGCVDRAGWSPARLDRLRGGRGPARPGAERLFPAEADPFFRAERLRPDPAVSLEAAFSILVVTEGSGQLETRGGSLVLDRGDTVLVPFAAGPGAVRGRLEAVRCLPPDPGGAP
ncbi:MAG TPA: class I mannose-6-phosphate isomerase [Actinomycetota bacterium]|nr:class I mannose-6-phosphate isomerase [Actinomycetota bacterium]